MFTETSILYNSTLHTQKILILYANRETRLQGHHSFDLQSVYLVYSKHAQQNLAGIQVLYIILGLIEFFLTV